MKNRLILGVALCVFSLLSVTASGQQAGTSFDKGVPLSLARYRKEVLSNVRYALHFTIPAVRSEAIAATETISFNLANNTQPLLIDFKEEPDRIISLTVNGKETASVLQNEHIIIPNTLLQSGANTVAIGFRAGELSLNRNNDYLYTLLVPDRARTVFPCFDQPDIKGRYRLSLTLPQEWKALSNAPLQDSVVKGSAKTYRYKESDLFSTYLFSFAAGRFDAASKTVDGRSMHFYYRETDSNKLRLSTDTIFKQHAAAVRFLENYTGIPFPFQKLDFVAIPDFQYGGMEHVGAINYKASALFLDSGATRDQENARSNLIAHETAHLWFGDLVTMQWFNDVWMKEVFANFMADKITQGSGNNYELKFLLTHLPRAYAVDRTAGANPIRQPLSNLQEAGNLYGAIIYNKAPVMMRQLERLMGAGAFRDGIRAYLKKYSFGNATWPDLIKLLDDRTPADLQAWNRVWVNTPGRPKLDYRLQQKGGVITRLTITQRGEQNAAYLLPQFFEIALVYPDRVEEYTVTMNKAEVAVKEAEGKKQPLYILFNSSGQGYGLFPVDQKALSVVSLKSSLMRASAYINWYENMLSGTFIKPAELLNLYKQIIANEPEELNLNLIAGQFTDMYWRLLPAASRGALTPVLEDVLWEVLQKEPVANKKKILFRTYQSIAQSKEGLDTLYAIWKEQKPPVGVTLSEDDYTSLALNLAVKGHPVAHILDSQLVRITNRDRKDRLQFLMPALSADVKVRDAFFASLKDQKIRKKESWVADALGYLHHPLRAATSVTYLKGSLEMLQEIQATGDIFFPGAWLGATFGPYQTTEAANIVRTFLEEHLGYNPKLKAKILQAADPLFRAEKLVK